MAGSHLSNSNFSPHYLTATRASDSHGCRKWRVQAGRVFSVAGHSRPQHSVGGATAVRRAEVSVVVATHPRYSFENSTWSRLSAAQSDLMTEMLQAFNESAFGSFRVERIEVVLAQVAVDDRVADEVIGDHD
jgi:hypothetical protein